MVKSGFVDRTDVSQYRLTVHLGMAFAILGYLLWVALRLVAPRDPTLQAPRRLAWTTFGIVSLTVLAGGLVAGLNAGLTYNSWPLMDGDFVPVGALEVSPWWLNGFENVAAVQFDHRMLAYASVFMVGWLWLAVRRAPVTPRARIAANAMASMAVAQVLLGIATLLLVVPLPLAVLHQLGAATLFSLTLWTVYELSG